MFIRKLTGLLVVCMLLASWGMAVSAAPAEEKAASAGAAQLALPDWVGKLFVVLPLELDKKPQGYTMFTLATPVAGSVNEQGYIRAEWLEGKRLEVTAVKLLATDELSGVPTDWEVTFKETETNAVLVAKALTGQVPQLVRYDDLINARTHFSGKTVFARSRAILEYKPYPGSITVGIDEPLKVVNVIGGITADEPIWLVVTTPSGAKGYIAIAYSNTNLSAVSQRQGNYWAAVLLENDPRKTYNWDDATWNAINAGTVNLGMVADQVRLAWGDPAAVEKLQTGEELWYYPANLATFANGVLTKLQDR